ncbi:flagellar export chaperone FliS [Geobacter sulfurreducens]|jgi:flagellar protein FliS|uniref:Flagellar secretion chaperone FliS n=1 Tax=Geobacter sulfurreducens (strain ATCC 51573 / DSM 12127 / PCA) TaxID=243231 RepID=Q748G6_GEOSL|nr:flagellar export chaperone FliS [Geobacter sulfurreducens]AAR36428.1 flagellin export facilitator protein FliS [Geobacter sulfurreducens PCA]ADI85788.1 flagellin export facilitator protein FliS [Geobacter sulfurreducens KN400]AJY69282.1 flagellar biosynthesis protein FliS [Geobacter sulfurreducens]QVW34836.1 flagellar export chaperone FliS [Geobacter sulfurreducens]UAC03706.1 flagellar export chaperone FliS [Geobacter sulfurreducens]
MLTPFNQYQNTQVGTASPEKILIMLYDGAINFSKIALERMEKKDLAGKGKYISKAQAIVSELMNTLNHDVGGGIAQRLEQLYIYVIDEYINANINNSPRALENAIRILTVLRDSWVEAIDIWKRERDAVPPSVHQPGYVAGQAR